jgi:hypothetical protein
MVASSRTIILAGPPRACCCARSSLRSCDNARGSGSGGRGAVPCRAVPCAGARARQLTHPSACGTMPHHAARQPRAHPYDGVAAERQARRVAGQVQQRGGGPAAVALALGHHELGAHDEPARLQHLVGARTCSTRAPTCATWR